jgi:diguanylate cyclase (GGDEF)-like protein
VGREELPAASASLRRRRDRIPGAGRDQDERNRQLTSLVAASRTVSSTLVLEDVLGRLAQAAVEALAADVCYIYEYLPQEDAIAWQAVFERVHGPQAQELGTVFPLADFPSDREVLERGVIVEENISDEDLRPTTRVSMEEWGQKTLLSVPLVIEGEPAGLFEVGQLERERHFTPQEVEFVGALGEQAAVAINNARQYRATERRNERLVRLVDVSQALNTSLDGGQIVERLESGLRSLFPNRTCVASVRLCAPDEPRTALKGLAKEAVRQHRPIQRPGRMSGRVVAPLFSGRRLLGLLQIVSEPRQPFAKDEIEIIQLVANQTAAAMENSRLYTSAERMAITDGLTGLYNHRYFYERLAQEVARARRYELPLSLLMIDIDDFKRYNDRLGHRAGDALLRGLAALLLTQTRQQVDLVARYGGEEFAIILPSTGPLGAARLGERLCDAIRESTIEDGLPSASSSSAAGEGARGQDGSTSAARAVGERIRHTIEKETFGSDEAPPVITVSVGVASMPDHATTVDGLVEEADEGLYRAKDLGKNRVEVPQVQAKQTR